MNNRTIVALSTPPMDGAIHIIRLNGDDAYSIINKITDKKVIKNEYSIQHCKILDNKKQIDDVLLMKFIAPKSFTGDDLIEINCHGGYFLANKIIKLLIKNGAKLANPGEFSKIAMINKKIDINQANAINNLVKSTNDHSIDYSIKGLGKENVKKLKQYISKLFTLMGQIEINIDYPEYDDVPNITRNKFIKELSLINKDLSNIIANSKKGIKINNGINISIIGEPNVGKSSLLNAILNDNKAIVSNIAGTTRDAIEGRINISGLTYNILDTAGIRNKTNNPIEKIGIKKTIELIDKSDLILVLVDGNKKSNNINTILKLVKNKNYLLVVNKSDLSQKVNIKNSINISAKNNKIDNLLNAIKKNSKQFKPNTNADVLIHSTASIGYLESAFNIINSCINDLKKKVPIDLIIHSLHEAHDDLLKVDGSNENYEFIDEMFSKFCLGK
jgi:tRNA modification GTPase